MKYVIDYLKGLFANNTSPAIEVEELPPSPLLEDPLEAHPVMMDRSQKLFEGIQALVEEHCATESVFPGEMSEEADFRLQRLLIKSAHQVLSFQIGCVEAAGCLIGWPLESRELNMRSYMKVGKEAILESHTEAGDCDCVGSHRLKDEIEND